jgi:hypothetical protein
MTTLDVSLLPEQPAPTPTIECGVTGPHFQPGFVLRARRVEELVWDIENEVTSPRRLWIADRSAWWIAASYLETVIDIVLRSFPSVLVIHQNDGDRLYSRDGSTALQHRLL